MGHKHTWLVTTPVITMALFAAAHVNAQDRTGWQQNDGPAAYAKIRSQTTREMFAAVNVPAPDAPGWFAAIATNGYFVNKRSEVTCNAEVDYTYFQTFFTLKRGSTLESLNLQFGRPDFDDGGMVIVNGDISRAIFIDKQTQTSLDLASQIRPGKNRIVVAQADNCRVLNKVPAMELVYKVKGASQPAVAKTVEPAQPAAPATRAPQPLPPPPPAPPPPSQSLSPPIARLALASDAPDGARRAAVAFVSSDGSARVGSRTVFTLVNTATGESVVVPVVGNERSTSKVVFVAPGTYRIMPPPPSVGQLTSFTTRNVSATQITATGGTAARPSATVTFGLESKVSPVALVVKNVTATSVSLVWAALPNVKVGANFLLRTDGAAAAPDPSSGTMIELSSPNATSAVAAGLAPGRQYTFTLFSASTSGEALPVRTYTVTTLKPNSKDAAFALAPNTIVPTDFASLRAQPLGDSRVRVTLNPARLQRASSSEIPGADASAAQGSGCVVGTPFLVTTAVAGNNSFYGVIDVCEAPTSGAPTAIVNGNVPLSVVFGYYELDSGIAQSCYDPATGQNLAVAQCALRAAASPVAQTRRQPAQPGPATSAPRGNVSTPARAAAPAGRMTLPLRNGTDLVRGEKYWSQSSEYYLSFQTDGNLVVKRADGSYIWGFDRQPNLDYRQVGRVSWQADGNLAAYTASGQYLWSAFTRNPDPTASLRINDDGVLQIVSGSRVLWSAANPPIGALQRPSPNPFAYGDGLPILQFASYEYPRQDYLASARSPMNDLAVMRNAAFVRPAPAYLPGQIASFGDIGSFNGGNGWAATPTMTMAAASKFTDRIKCQGSGQSVFDLNQSLEPVNTTRVTLNGGELSWNIKAGVKASINPEVSFSAEVKCALEFEGKSFQISNYPIPVNLELTPDISATATGTASLNGPSLSLTLGLNTNGKLYGRVETCTIGWRWASADVPCGIESGVSQNSSPWVEFNRGNPTATLSGTLTFAAGLEANLGLGVKNSFVTAKNGFALTMLPLSAELSGSLTTGSTTCIQASMGYQIGGKLVAEAFVLSWGKKWEVPLFETGHRPYPGAQFAIGECD